MQIIKKIEINRSADVMWKIIAEDFDQAHKWMGFVTASYALASTSDKAHQSTNNAPMAGRVCEFTDKPDGLKAEERILDYSRENMQLTFDVVPRNTPLLFPVHNNVVTMTVRALADQRTEVIWESNVRVTKFGRLIYPLLKRGLTKNFASIMDDLDKYATQTIQAA